MHAAVYAVNSAGCKFKVVGPSSANVLLPVSQLTINPHYIPYLHVKGWLPQLLTQLTLTAPNLVKMSLSDYLTFKGKASIDE